MNTEDSAYTSSADYGRYTLAELKRRLVSEFEREFDETAKQYPDNRVFLSFVATGFGMVVRRAGKKADATDVLANSRASSDVLRHWARMPNWTQFETAALLAGLDPSLLSGKESDIVAIAETSSDARKIANVLEIMKRGSSHYVTPLQVVSWAERFDVVVPEQLKKAVIDFWGESERADAEVERSQGTKLRADREETLLRVVAGLWEISGLPKKPTTAADRLEALFTGTGDGGWGWEKPSKKTMADTVFSLAAKLPRNQDS
ncbi:hypothetical protein ACWKWK_15620 [Pseudoxanthomonas beigongshangi]